MSFVHHKTPNISQPVQYNILHPIHIPLALSNNVSKARNLVPCALSLIFRTFIHIGKWTVENDLVCYTLTVFIELHKLHSAIAKRETRLCLFVSPADEEENYVYVLLICVSLRHTQWDLISRVIFFFLRIMSRVYKSENLFGVLTLVGRRRFKNVDNLTFIVLVNVS